MLLTIDIGNSSTKLALFDSGSIIARTRFETDPAAAAADLKVELRNFVDGALEGIAISSVVRELRASYEQAGAEHFKTAPLFVDHTHDLGFEIDYKPPSDCGPDRLVAAYAAVQNAGYPVIVCDFGTATTIDLVDAENVYRGGIIAPGIETMSDSLFENTSRLPKIEVKPALKVVGDSTAGSIRSGIYYGYIGLVDGIIARMQSGLESVAPVIATGGFSELIAGGSKHVEQVEPDLIHHGLREMWERAKPL